MASGQTANDAYVQVLAQVTDLVERLPAALRSHAERQASRPLDWGYPGDMHHVREVLAEALRSLGG